MINDKKFKLMKNNLILINVSRGEIINEKSLINNMKSKNFSADLDHISNEQKIDFNKNKLLNYAKSVVIYL